MGNGQGTKGFMDLKKEIRFYAKGKKSLVGFKLLEWHDLTNIFEMSLFMPMLRSKQTFHSNNILYYGWLIF